VFRQHLDRVREEYGHPPVRWYASGTEIGAADFINAWDQQMTDLPLGPSDGVLALPPRGDKFVRALGLSAAWNGRKVMMKEGAAWLDDFMTEFSLFTGVADGQADQVDAAVAAFDELGGSAEYTEDLDAEKYRGVRRW
jgi:phage terminase large subunit-like protein